MVGSFLEAITNRFDWFFCASISAEYYYYLLLFIIIIIIIMLIHPYKSCVPSLLSKF